MSQRRQKHREWLPISTAPRDGSWFAIGAEFEGKVVWWTSAAWDDEYNSFYNFVHSNHNLIDINDPRFVGWRPMQQPF